MESKPHTGSYPEAEAAAQLRPAELRQQLADAVWDHLGRQILEGVVEQPLPQTEQ